MEDLKLKMLQEHFKDVTDLYLTYKRDQDKILFFAGTVFISIITITGVFGAFKLNNVIYNFRWYHLLIFHTIFFILFLFHSYKMLCAQMYYFAGIEIQKAINKLLNINQATTLNLVDLKQHILGDTLKKKSLKSGLNPGVVANILILLLYFLTSVSPYVYIWLKPKDGLTINSDFWTVCISGAFVILFIIVNRNITKRRKRIKEEVNREYGKTLEKFIGGRSGL